MEKQNKKMENKMDSKTNCRDMKNTRKDLGHQMKTDKSMNNCK